MVSLFACVINDHGAMMLLLFPLLFWVVVRKEKVVLTSNDHDFQEYIMYINLTGGCSVLMFNFKKKNNNDDIWHHFSF